MVNGSGSGIELGAGLKISNPAIGVGGLVVLGAIGAHLVTSLFGPKRRAMAVAHKTSTPSIHEAMYSEIEAMATDPTVVARNADRVNEALKQRRDYIKTLREKVNAGTITHQQFAEAVQQHASDVADQLGIPQAPHPASHPADYMKNYRASRVNQLMQDFAVPGGLILDPAEKAFIEHQQMSYPAEADKTQLFALKEAAKLQQENARLARLRQREQNWQNHKQAIIQKDLAQDAFVQGIHERKKAGVAQ